jgi:hypothetical protein
VPPIRSDGGDDAVARAEHETADLVGLTRQAQSKQPKSKLRFCSYAGSFI